MPSTNEPPDNQTSQESPRRRRSKPKFEIPTEAGLPPAAGWVYKATEGSGQESRAQTARRPPMTSSQPGPVLIVSLGLFSLGFEIAGRICLTAIDLSTIPIAVMRRLLISD